jgi:hypothetical protein
MFRKSCSSSHTEHNKNGFAILGFFYDFINILQVAAKTHKEVKNHFARGSLESFKRSQICPSFAPNTLEKLGALQCSPWATGAARPARIPATSPAFCPRERSGVTTSARGVNLWSGLARKRRRRAVTAEAGGGCCESGVGDSHEGPLNN